MSARQIEDALANAYGSRQISSIFTPNNEYQVVLEVKPEFQENPNLLSRLYIRSASRTCSCRWTRSWRTSTAASGR